MARTYGRFNNGVKKALKNSQSAFCEVSKEDGYIYLVTEHFTLKMMPIEYEEVARPVFMRDPGNWHMMGSKFDECPPDGKWEKYFRDWVSSVSSEQNLLNTNLLFDASNGKEKQNLVKAFYSEGKDFPVLVSDAYVSMLNDFAYGKAAGPLTGVVCFDPADNAMAFLLPVRPDKRTDGAVRGYFQAVEQEA